MDKDRYFMEIALRLAKKAQGRTSPNPMVGALVVKGSQILGLGYHKKAGSPHAEVLALSQAKDRSKGATLYVTLEPCCHFGRTSPCVDRILQSGIKRVVVAMRDPNPINNGRGIKILRSKKIDVKIGILREKAERLNEVFIKYITKGMPFVTVKVGQSLDGRIATGGGDSQWITNQLSRDYVRKLRSRFDAILVGANTVLKDNPLLAPSLTRGSKSPIKIIVDSKLRSPLESRVFSDNSTAIVATTRFAPKRKVDDFKREGIRVLIVKDKNGRVCLDSLLKKLAKMEITSLLVEGGGEIIGSLFDKNLVDKILFFIAPKIIGGKRAISSVEGSGIKRIGEAKRLKDIKIRRFGEDILIEGNVK
jgi:diaminohydroxyphosphoribosylaminopyrimidine deaminase/5-amino-6-(5-phosphoribosylamino)uracil reductase